MNDIVDGIPSPRYKILRYLVYINIGEMLISTEWGLIGVRLYRCWGQRDTILVDVRSSLR